VIVGQVHKINSGNIMAAYIDYYFTCMSPFAFLGHDALIRIGEKHGKEIRFKPFNLFGVWEVSGAVPPPKRPPVRQRYRLLELQRIAALRGVALNLKPAFFPTDPSLADHCVIAIGKAGGNPAAFARSAAEALWVRELQIAEEAVIGALLSAAGHDADAILAGAKEPSTAETRLSNTEDAIAADAVGAPAYVYDGEVFWGQDRVDYLDHMIESGRPAFSAG
jgi:2-hydroxychromene-2-carboxylate isomerase